MKKYILNGGKNLSGTIRIAGAKNVISKVLIAACLTDEEVILHNAPLISDLYTTLEILKSLGVEYTLEGHTIRVKATSITNSHIPLEYGAKARVSSMFVAPLLHRVGSALIPNPGGCRLGARPIDRHIEALRTMGAEIDYDREDGNFHAQATGLHGTEVVFEKNTHTGTETVILAAVLAHGETLIHNAALEPEIDDLIQMLMSMGAKIERLEGRKIKIQGVEKLHGTEFSISSDRNEVVTFAIASAITGGNIWIENVDMSVIEAFLDAYKKAGGAWEEKGGKVRFYIPDVIQPVEIVTAAHPGFMTDWQGPWSVLMTQAEGESIIHETIYENRFMYVAQLRKMGAKIEFFQPQVNDPKTFYNFNCENGPEQDQAIRITGRTMLHNAIMKIEDLRAGATLVLAALLANGESIIYGIEHVERGYEQFEQRLSSVGVEITVVEDSL